MNKNVKKCYEIKTTKEKHTVNGKKSKVSKSVDLYSASRY